jgi:hypothetical protein
MTHEEGRIWYYENADGTREYSGYCYCEECEEYPEDGPKPYNQVVAEPPAGATYQYKEETRGAEETALAVFVEWGHMLGCEISTIQEMVYTLRPGDYFIADEPWACKAKITRLS